MPTPEVAIVYGTRPEAIKLWPLVQALVAAGHPPHVLNTGQHTNLLTGTPSDQLLRTPNAQHLHLPSSGNPLSYAQTVRRALQPILESSPQPDLLLVQGDTASAYGAALAARDAGIPLGHVEAGVRTGCLTDPWPEELFRRDIDELSRWWFCATTGNRRQVIHDVTRFTWDPDWAYAHCWETGNTGIDALYAVALPVPVSQRHPRCLITLHRRESLYGKLYEIVEGILSAARTFPRVEFLWPAHPNPGVQQALPSEADRPRNLRITSPLDRLAFIDLLAHSQAVLTDSGGVQEEAAALGIPCVVARDHTDRPESVQGGWALLAGRTAPGIIRNLTQALTGSLKTYPSTLFGDGHASQRIVQVLQS